MDKIRRVERIAALTKLLSDAPQVLFPLNEFCEFFSIAKSTLSEDLTVVRKGLAHYGLGRIETVSGAAGGVRFIPERKGDRAKDVLFSVEEILKNPNRIIPGGFIYVSDILYDWSLANALGEILMSRFAHTLPDYILTVETKGIPLAMMVARAFNKPLAIARRDSKVTEGSSISINYVTGEQRRIQTMSLTKRAIPHGAKVLIIDDFMKGGGTAKGMKALVHEIGGQVVGVGVLMATRGPSPKLIDDYKALFEFIRVDEEDELIDIKAIYDERA